MNEVPHTLQKAEKAFGLEQNGIVDMDCDKTNARSVGKEIFVNMTKENTIVYIAGLKKALQQKRKTA